jgi:hypothetical protein
MEKEGFNTTDSLSVSTSASKHSTIPCPPSRRSDAIPPPPLGPTSLTSYAREIEMKEMIMNPMRKSEEKKVKKQKDEEGSLVKAHISRAEPSKKY